MVLQKGQEKIGGGAYLTGDVFDILKSCYGVCESKRQKMQPHLSSLLIYPLSYDEKVRNIRRLANRRSKQ